MRLVTAGASLLVCAAALAAAQPDVVFDAMKAELARTMTLSIGELDKPYYASYTVDDVHLWTGSATLGGLLAGNSANYRIPTVRVRVGDYKFDNTNFAGGPGGGGARYDLRGFPLDDDPLVIRQYLWLATDSAFKGSLRAIASKRSALRSVTVNNQLADFSLAPKFSLIRDFQPIAFDHEAWKAVARRVSTAFSAFPSLRASQVEFSAVNGLHRMVTSEGTEIRQQQDSGSVQIRATAQAADGMVVRDSALFYTRDIGHMFPEAKLTAAARQVGESVTKMAAAPVGENYSGPILFEGTASPQLMAEVLGRNLHIARKPVAPPGFPNQASATELEGRRGVRIMPEFFDVADDPAKPLFGQEEVDDEGVPDKPVSLVEKGILKDFLRTREPVRGYAESNGHARLGGNSAAPTNLLITAREKTPLAEMRRKMIDLCQQRGMPYGIIVRKMDFPSTASLDEARRIQASGSAGGARAVSMPLYVYRLYVDGHEELVRGLRMRGLNARSLKDILAAGDDSTEFDYLENGAPFALLGLGSTAAEVAVVAPSVLIDDLELTKIDDEMPKLPIVPSPATLTSAVQ